MSLQTKLVSELNSIKARVTELTAVRQSSSENHLVFDLSQADLDKVSNRTRRQKRFMGELERLEAQIVAKKEQLQAVDNELIELRSKQARLKTEGQIVTVSKRGRNLSSSENAELITLRAREAELRATARKFHFDV